MKSLRVPDLPRVFHLLESLPALNWAEVSHRLSRVNHLSSALQQFTLQRQNLQQVENPAGTPVASGLEGATIVPAPAALSGGCSESPGEQQLGIMRIRIFSDCQLITMRSPCAESYQLLWAELDVVLLTTESELPCLRFQRLVIDQPAKCIAVRHSGRINTATGH